jgi:hypothetical protein
VSNFIVYQYMGCRIDSARHPRLARYLRDIAATDAYRKALDAEKPFVANIGLFRTARWVASDATFPRAHDS